MSRSRPTGDEGDASAVQIACVGLGFVGYNSALAFGRSEYPVVGVDTNEELIEAVERGNAPFEAPQLRRHIEDGSCRVTTDISDASDASVYVISVPTPLNEDSAPDLSYVRSAARDVSTVLDPGNLVVLQSTVYPGCTRSEVIPELERSGLELGSEFGVSHVPERYSPGNEQSKRATRVVGSIDDEWRDLTADLYEDLSNSTAPVSSLEAAEMTKLVENVQRDVNIALMNELALAAEGLGIDVWEVIEGADTKWNFHRYEPGLGVGGHCLPIDPQYLRVAAEKHGAELDLVSVARAVNDSMPGWYADRLRRALDAVGKAPSAVVAVLGATYKPGVKDTRNSPALELIDRLQSAGLGVRTFDPQFDSGEEIAPGISNGESAMTVVRGADAVVVATAHEPFSQFEPATLASVMGADPIVVDPRRTFDPDAVAESELLTLRDVNDREQPDRRSTAPARGVGVCSDERGGDDD